MTTPPPTLVVTSGEPAGIGPDICAMLGTRDLAARLVVLCDPDVVAERIRDSRLDVALRTLDSPAAAEPHATGTLQVLPLSVARPVRPGRLDPENAAYVLKQLELGVDACRGITQAALVTAPVQKSVINEAGIPFTGHTEWLAERTGTRRPVMMLTSSELRVALATTHLPLRRVAEALTRESLEEVITVLDRDLRSRFALESPRIMVLGLNPHAGENGVLGTEETQIIEPALRALSQRGMKL